MKTTPKLNKVSQRVASARLAALGGKDRKAVAAPRRKSASEHDEKSADAAALARSEELACGRVQPKQHTEVFKNAFIALAQTAWAADWNTPEENKAWRNL